MNQREFYDLPEVKAQQEIQKRNPYGSVAHRSAYREICRLAVLHGAPKDEYDPEDY